MIRGTWVWDRETCTLVPKSEWQRKQPKAERSDFPCPMISTGQLDDVWNPTDGKRYSTLRNYEKSIPNGHHIVERGELEGDSSKPAYTPEPERVKQDIATAWDQLEAGYKTGD